MTGRSDYSKLPKLLTIAGSDSAGCAGIQADLKAFAALRCHGMSVLTSVTAQNTLGVTGIHDVPVDIIERQIDAVLTDVGADAIKTGMLSSRAIVEAVAAKLRQLGAGKLVVDPVLAASSGDLLLQTDAIDSLRRQLFPLARLVTPNLREAEVLSQLEIRSVDEMAAAARAIYSFGSTAVLVKGGHLEGPAVDIYFDGRAIQQISAARIQTADAHGAGCTLASAIAAFLGHGYQLEEACHKGKAYVTAALQASFRIGSGRGPLGHFYEFWK